MSEHVANIRWMRQDGDDFLAGQYSRIHQWCFDGGAIVQGNAAPAFVPEAFAKTDQVDPEEAFVASLSSCHMLFFLAFAAKKKLVVDSYDDTASGVLDKNEEGLMCMTEVRLQPKVSFSGEVPSGEVIEALHEKAHKACFIANSVKSEVIIDLSRQA